MVGCEVELSESIFDLRSILELEPEREFPHSVKEYIHRVGPTLAEAVSELAMPIASPPLHASILEDNAGVECAHRDFDHAADARYPCWS